MEQQQPKPMTQEEKGQATIALIKIIFGVGLILWTIL